MIKMSILTNSLFISFEGIDGCGKSTQVKLLMKKLEKESFPSLLVREPGGSKIAEDIRNILLDKNNVSMSGKAEALLMTASRAQLTKEVILPKLKEGFIVIADRYQDSTIAYQGGGRGLDINFLKKLNNFATSSLKPDLTFYIDISTEEGLKRTNAVDFDRIESAGQIFQKNVRKEYLELVKEYPERIMMVDGNLSIKKIHNKIWDLIKQKINIKT